MPALPQTEQKLKRSQLFLSVKGTRTFPMFLYYSNCILCNLKAVDLRSFDGFNEDIELFPDSMKLAVFSVGRQFPAP